MFINGNSSCKQETVEQVRRRTSKNDVSGKHDGRGKAGGRELFWSLLVHRISIYVTGGKIRVYGGNKGAREFSCGQRDLCRLSEAQPQAGNSMGKKIMNGGKGGSVTDLR